MRSAAALAPPSKRSRSAIFEVGHFSRFAPREPRFGADRKLRQGLGDIIDRAERMQRTCRGKTDFVDAGVIGASIFSPRPARGYRFHSLQVEIISCSYSPEGRNHFQYRSGGVDFAAF
jgi:hypothetical protein